MKKYLLLPVLAILLFGCSQDDSFGSDKGDGAGGSLAVFALKGNYLYSVDRSDLQVFSLLNPLSPVKVNDVPIGFDIETLFSNGDYLYIGSETGMYIYSVANPESPELVSAVQHFTACDPVVANDTHAFVTLHSTAICGNVLNRLEVYDIADSSNPLLIHTRNLVEPKGLGLYYNHLFVCDDEIKIFNLDNPEQPLLVGSLPPECFDVIITDNVLFAIGAASVYRYTLNPNDITDITLESTIVF